MINAIDNKLDNVLREELGAIEIAGPPAGLTSFISKIPKTGLSYVTQIIIITVTSMAVVFTGIIMWQAGANHAYQKLTAKELHNVSEKQLFRVNYTSKGALPLEDSNERLAFATNNTVQNRHTGAAISTTKNDTYIINESEANARTIMPAGTENNDFKKDVSAPYFCDTVVVYDTVVVVDTVLKFRQQKIIVKSKRKNTRR